MPAWTFPLTSTVFDTQVRPLSVKKPYPYRRGSLHNPTPKNEVVWVQRQLLDVNRVEDYDADKTWSFPVLIRECINPVTTKKTLTIRFEDGHEEDVCEGAVHRPGRAPRTHRHPLDPRQAHMGANGEGLHPDRGMTLSGSQPPRPDVLAPTARRVRTQKLRTAPVESKFLLCTQRHSPPSFH
jgi:hypothetical protein